MKHLIVSVIRNTIFVLALNCLPAIAAEVKCDLPDDINYSSRQYFIPKTPEANCANSVVKDLKNRIIAMGIPLVESGSKTSGKGTFYYPRDTNPKDAKGRIIVPNRQTIKDASPMRNLIDFKNILERHTRYFTYERPKTYSCASHLRQLPMSQLLPRQCDALGLGLGYELGLGGSSGLGEEQFYSSVGMHDGGNSLILQNKQGAPKLIIGEAEVIYNVVFLRRRGFFEDATRDKNFHITTQQYAKISELLDGKSINEWISEQSVIALTNISQNDKTSLYQSTFAMGFNAQHKTGDAGDINIGKFLAQKEFVSKVLMPLDFSVNPEQVVIVPQIFYHLDLYIAPTSLGEVLLPDFDLAIRDIRKLAQKVDEEVKTKLGEDASCILVSLSNETQKLINSFNITNKLEQTKAILEEAGFGVVSAPVAALGTNNRFIAALNPIYGINKLTGKLYWFVAGISLGAKKEEILASKYLMNHWKTLITDNIFTNLDVEFAYVGEAPVKNNQDPFADCRLLHEKWAGLHCLTADLK